MDVEMNDALCLSEDSEFYGDTLSKESTINCSASVLIRLRCQGDEHLEAELERRAIEYDPTTYWDTSYLSPNDTAILNIARWDRQCRTPLYNPYEGNPAGRQLSESLPDFLARLPPLTTSINSLGSPWIWIANPYTGPRPLDQDLAALTINGKKILAELSTNLQGCMDERKQALLRGRAIKMILDVAITTGVTTGKWMLFPESRIVNSVWKVVADNTASGELGICAKVATGSEDMNGKTKQESLICVYTKNFSDGEDVRRVVRQMEILDLVPKIGPPWIYYKCDAFTHLDINSGNQWGLKASLLSSYDVFSTSLKKERQMI